MLVPMMSWSLPALAGSKFMVPMKSATKSVCGLA
jgi:hypothetical protein